ncbi:MAG: xylulokinase [Acidimicrobiales bacterium]
MGEHVLAVDLGTSGAKVALVATDGRIAGHELEPVGLRLLSGGGAEQDPDQWWQAIVAATRRLLAQPDAPSSRAVVAACMSGQWGGTVAVDSGGRPVHPAVIWMDSRGAPHARRLVGGGLQVPGTGLNARRLRRWLARTGGLPSTTGKDPVGQIAWLRHERRDAYEAATWFLDVPEYLTMRLTGEAVAAVDTAVLRWCTDNRDPDHIRYDPDLVALCGLDAARLPRLVAPASVVGPIRPAAARELGLGEHVQVVAGTGDTAAAAVGAGAVLDHQAHLYVGTSAWLSCHTPYKKTDLRTNVASLPAVVPGRYWVATVQDVAGKALSWLVDHVLYPDDGLTDDASAPTDVLERLNAVAAKAPPGSHGVVFVPWLNGERTPVEDERLRGGWFNLSLTTDRADLVRSVFEGVALNARWMLEAVERFVRRRCPDGIDCLTFVGGGATSELWCQVMADVLGRPIKQAEDPMLANVRGAGLIGGVALGKLQWHEIPRLVAVRETFQPDDGLRTTYDHLFRTFGEIHRRTKSLYARHNRVGWS